MKRKVYELRMQGLSFGKIAERLGISKSTAFGHFKEFSHSMGNNQSKHGQNSSELNLNVRSERSDQLPIIQKLEDTKESTLKEIVANDLVKIEFDSLDFTGKFLELIGKPSRIFSGIIWGLPKGGKSNLSIRFADYLQEYFGDVVYIAAEEGVSASLKEKFIQIKGGGVTVVECRNREEIRNYIKIKSFQFVFIDSINVAGIDNEFLELIKSENPKKSFVSIVQATKSGNFKGDQSLTHNCDFVIKVIGGIAYHHGRFGPSSEINIFEGELYSKNQKKRKAYPEAETTDKAIEILAAKQSVTSIIPEEKKMTLPQIKFNFPPSQESQMHTAISMEIEKQRKIRNPAERNTQIAVNHSGSNETISVVLKVATGFLIIKGIAALFESKPSQK